MKKVILLLIAGLILTEVGRAQLPASVRYANIDRNLTYTLDSVYVISDAQFRNKDTNRWLLGDHYRREWITPVKVPVVRLDTLYGGVSVKKVGGGKQTMSLQLDADNSNKEYVIRSIEKFPSRALPPELANTIAAEFVKDQISSAHPFAPPVITVLADAAGIYHTNPRMVYVPRSERLKEFDSLYGNQFYLLEERPRGNWNDYASFGHSANIVSTEKLRERLMTSSKVKADEAAYLRARLLDLLIGDWDRHEDQWTWAEAQAGPLTLYRPIPKDRDQAFAKLDGVLPWLGRRKWALRRAQHFDYKVPDVKGLTWSGRNLDRLLLTSLEWEDWAKEVQFVQSRWTDAVLDEAVRQLPPELYPISGVEIKNKMISRRNDLLKYAHTFYLALAKEVEWEGTDDKDRFVVTGQTDSSFRVQQFNYRNDEWVPVKARTFLTKDTREMRLFGLEGNDEFRAEGNYPIPHRVRWIGGDGQNQYMDAREGKSTKPIRLYDTALHKKEGDFRVHKRYDSLTHQYHYGTYDYNMVRPVLLPGYNADDGVFIGLGVDFKKHDWGYTKYAQEHFIGGNYAFATGAFNFWYDGIFYKGIGPWDILVQGRLNQPNHVFNFYGFGNETAEPPEDKDFNRVRVKQAIIRPGVQRVLDEKHIITLLAEWQSNLVDEDEKRFVTPGNPDLDSFQFERHNWWGGSAGYTFTTLNSNVFPTKGLLVNTTSHYLFEANQSKDYFNQEASFRFFIPLGKLVFGSRIGGAKLWGNPQFFQYNQLSGLENLRGYRRSRFSGESMVYNNNELRIPLTDINAYLLNGKLGLTLFMDNGRVWMPDEESSKWHWGYGGGIWILPFGRVAFSAYYGVSTEDQLVTVKTGFLF